MKYRFVYDDAIDVVGVHLVGSGAVLGHALVMSGMIGLVVDRLKGSRIGEEQDLDGIHLAVHAEAANDLHATAGARASSSLLGTGSATREDHP
ncbi:MAG: hypothetical protein WB471_02825 [Nocardioides sp.]